MEDKHVHGMVLCVARLSAAIMVSYFTHVKTHVEAHKMHWNCEVVYLFHR